MIMKKDQSRLILLAVISVLALASRFLPHPPNFAPMAALALLAGREIHNRFWAMGLTFILMLVSDLFLGFASSSGFVYFGFLLVGCFSIFLFRNGSSPIKWIAAPLGSSAIFFVVSNFGVWAVDGLYPRTAEGLMTCFTMALPFYHWSLASDLFYWTLFSGVLSLATQSSWARLSQKHA